MYFFFTKSQQFIQRIYKSFLRIHRLHHIFNKLTQRNEYKYNTITYVVATIPATNILFFPTAKQLKVSFFICLKEFDLF